MRVILVIIPDWPRKLLQPWIQPPWEAPALAPGPRPRPGLCNLKDEGRGLLGKGCGAAVVRQGRPGNGSERLRLAQPLPGRNLSLLKPK